MIRGMKLKDKKASAFGSYGWSGEATKLIIEELKKSGFLVEDEGIKTTWTPDQNVTEECIKFGENFAKFISKISKENLQNIGLQ